MENNVQKALNAALKQYGKINSHNTTAFIETITQVFNANKPYLEKVAELDEAFDEMPVFEPLREVFFDLLLINFFNEDVIKLEEDYLESKEWEGIEEQTLDRGTELLNLLLYLKECEEEGLEPELGDYLKEFLLVEEDEFQDEHRIYEDVIANQILVESPVEEIAQVARGLSDFSEFKELFYPVMCFFKEQNPSEPEFDLFVNNSPNPEFDAALYAILISYNK